MTPEVRLELLQQSERRVQVLAECIEQLRERLQQMEERGWDSYSTSLELAKWQRLLSQHVRERDRLREQGRVEATG